MISYFLFVNNFELIFLFYKIMHILDNNLILTGEFLKITHYNHGLILEEQETIKVGANEIKNQTYTMDNGCNVQIVTINEHSLICINQENKHIILTPFDCYLDDEMSVSKFNLVDLSVFSFEDFKITKKNNRVSFMACNNYIQFFFNQNNVIALIYNDPLNLLNSTDLSIGDYSSEEFLFMLINIYGYKKDFTFNYFDKTDKAFYLNEAKYMFDNNMNLYVFQFYGNKKLVLIKDTNLFVLNAQNIENYANITTTQIGTLTIQIIYDNLYIYWRESSPLYCKHFLAFANPDDNEEFLF